jgi:hypothetical protein
MAQRCAGDAQAALRLRSVKRARTEAPAKQGAGA